MSAAKSILAFWQSLGLPMHPGASAAEIALFERHYSVRLPCDFRDYLFRCNGMDGAGNWISDDECITFWRLPTDPDSYGRDYDVICPASVAWPQCSSPLRDSLFVFADYCIGVFDFAIQLSTDHPQFGAIFRLADENPEPIAESFSRFAERYIASRDDILFF